MKRIVAVLLVSLMMLALIPFGVSADIPANAFPFWLTHYNDRSTEGSGVIMTEKYNATAWRHQFQFSPTDVEGVYEITDIWFGAYSDEAVAFEIPAGGFVYMLNIGNDYPSLYEQNPWEHGYADLPDYTNFNCDYALAISENWSIGDQFAIYNLDLENHVVPTTTPDTPWYEDTYVCTAKYLPYTGNAAILPDVPDTEPEPDTAQSFAVDITASETAVAGKQLTVNIDINNITVENGLHCVQFLLNYDATALSLANDLLEDEENVVDCIVSAPNDWENLTNVNHVVSEGVATPVNDGIINCGFMTPFNTADTAITADGAISLKITFDVIGEVGSETVISVNDSDTLGAYNGDNYIDEYTGQGSAATVTITDISGDVSSDDSSDDSSEGSQDNSDIDSSDDSSDSSADDSSNDESHIPEGPVPEEIEIGDVNADGAIDQFDYILVKRDYFDTYTLTEDEAKRANVNYDEVVDQFDYILLKRAYFGTYIIEQK